MKKLPFWSRRLISWLAFLGLIGLIGYAVVRSQVITILAAIAPSSLIPLVIGRTLYLASNGLFLDAFTAKLGIQLRPMEWVGLPFVTAMGNQLTPFSGGMIARATYLKRFHCLSYTVFLSLLAANYLVIFGTMGLLGGFTTLLSLRSLARPWPLVGLFFTTTAAIVALVSFPRFRFPGPSHWAERLNSALSSWDQIRSDRQLLVRVVGYEFLGVALNALSFLIAYRALGTLITIPAALLVSLVTGFAVVVSITPGNWGLQEAVITVTSALVGAGTEQGLAVALLIRAATLASAFTLGPLFSYLLAQQERHGNES